VLYQTNLFPQTKPLMAGSKSNRRAKLAVNKAFELRHPGLSRGTELARRRPMTDAEREALELRAIVVSTRVALASEVGPDDRERIKTTSTELLAQLLERVISDGADPRVMANIQAARRDLWN
jgi:hypothetical protein